MEQLLAQTRFQMKGDPDQGRLALSLLGSFALHRDDSELELPPLCERAVAVVALLGRASRSRVSGTLWPETSEERARSNLRNCIWRTNQVAKGLLRATPATLDLDSRVELDVRQFVERARTIMAAATAPAAADIHELIDNAAELLPDWDDGWLAADRERLRLLRLHRLEQAAEVLASNGQYGLALDAAMAAVRTDPLRESAHRIVISLHLNAGNRVQARRAYETCRQVLVSEGGVEPSQAAANLVAPLDSLR